MENLNQSINDGNYKTSRRSSTSDTSYEEDLQDPLGVVMEAEPIRKKRKVTEKMLVKINQIKRECKIPKCVDVQLVAGAEEAALECDICGNKYDTKEIMKTHLLEHRNILLRNFHEYGKLLASIAVLSSRSKARYALKNKVGKYLCNQCYKTFRKPSGLSRHLLTHTNVKPYPCSQCDKKFKSPDHLKKHLKIHTEVKPYPCQQCSKAFKSPSNLKEHMQVHSSVRPYLCRQCSKTFKSPSHLKQHFLKLHCQ